MAFSHANCDHPATPAARKKCRDNQKKLADGKIKDTVNVREMQQALTEAYRAQLLQIGSHSVEEILEVLQVEIATSDIDKWFQGELPHYIKIVDDKYRETYLLTTKYLKEHAALLGYKAGKLEYVNPVVEQIAKSLAVTGPVAFKKHIAAGGTVDEAVEVMKTTLSGSAERLALQGAHDTLTQAVASDTSDVLGYSRQTSSTACDYCTGLSREAIYDSNTFHAHDHCTCTGEPIYLDPRFLPTAGQVDFNRDWDNAVDTRNRALEIDRVTHEWDFDLGGSVNEAMLEDFGPMLVWRELVDGVTHPYVKGIRDKGAIRAKARNMGEDDPEYFEWLAYADALRAYTSEIYDSMNRMLRGLPRAAHRDDNIKDSGGYIPDDDIMAFNKDLLNFFKKEASVLPDDYQLYRGIKDANVVFGDYADGDLTGMVFTDKGFTSTTISEKTAKGFIDNAFEGGAPNPVLMRIVGKKGTKAVAGNGTEAEVIFAPGVRYRIVRDYEKTVGTGLRKPQKQQRWLDVEIVDSVEEMAKEVKNRPEIIKEFDEAFADLEKAVKKFEKAAEGLDSTESLYKIQESLAGEEDFKLIADAFDAFQYYVNDGYSGMNKYLREGIVEFPEDLSHVRALVKYFESARVHVVKQDIAVYRGVKSMWKVFGKGWEDNLKGVEFTDKGFFSVSTSQAVAKDFVKNLDKEGAIFRIIVPKGTKALKGNNSESEIVLAPGTKFRIVKDWVNNGKRTIDLEVISG